MAWWNRARGERRVPRDVADAGLDSGHQIHIQATPGYDRLGVAMVREVQVSDAGESDLWRRYTQGEEPANDAEAQRFEAFRRHDQEWSGYWEEREAFRRYAAGDAPRDAAERQRFARFDQELADDIDARHPGQHGEQGEPPGRGDGDSGTREDSRPDTLPASGQHAAGQSRQSRLSRPGRPRSGVGTDVKWQRPADSAADFEAGS